MNIPYFAQVREDSCGAAVLQMLTHLYGSPLSQETLIQKLDIRREGLTTKAAIRSVLRELSLQYYECAEEAPIDIPLVAENNLEHLLHYVAQEVPVIVNYHLPDGEGHYALVVASDKEYIILHDPLPECGPKYKIRKEDFDQRWISGNMHWKKWFIAVLK